MSGVEIAGLLLGAFPLMISALEHYRDTAEVLEGWWKVKTEYKKCMRSLKYHQITFEENLEALLLPLIADEDKLQLLLNEPGGPAWKEPELEAILRQRMPKTYSSYLDTVEEMLETVQGLHDSLGTSKPHFQTRVMGEYTIEKTPSGTRAVIAHVTAIGMQNIEFQAQRIKLAFNKPVRQQLFEEFGKQNARLSDILGSSDRLAGLRQARVSKPSVNAGLWKFWNHGNILFNLLVEAWSCKCQSSHHANLLLQHRAAPTVNFRVIFWFKRQLAVGQYPWIWQDTSIKLLEEASSPIVAKIHVPPISNAAGSGVNSPLTTASNAILSPRPAPTPTASPSPLQVSSQITNQKINGKDHHKSKRRSFMDKFKSDKSPKSSPSDRSENNVPVSLDNQPIPSPSQQQLSTDSEPNKLPKPKPKVAFVNIPARTSIDDSTIPKIADLCTKISTCSPDLPHYGCLKGNDRRYSVQPLCKTAKEPQNHITLDTLLSPNSPVAFTRRQRLQIALILASSQIQLHPTPWLKSKWSKKDILFLYDPRDPSKVSTEQPYISRSLCKSLKSPNTLISPHAFQDSIRNLGIMLLELCFGKTIEECRHWHNATTSNEAMLQVFNYGTADAWSRDVVEEAGPEYADAVTWCLHNVPDSGDGEGREERWREDMYAKVVEPLRYCCDQLMAVQKGMGT